MRTSRSKKDRERIEKLHSMLVLEQTHTSERVRRLREEQRDDATPTPGDELDEAHSLAEVETHAGLIERAEFRLKAIDSALQRLERGIYGTCEECGEEIPFQRLQSLPFAAYCVDCQRKRNKALRAGQGDIDEFFAKRWTPAVEPGDDNGSGEPASEDRLSVRDEKPFGAEVGEFEQMVPVATARRRGRIKQRTR